MRELTDEASILLKELKTQLKEHFGRIDVEPASPERDYLAELKNAEMIECIGAWGHPVIIVTGITAKGIEHINALKQACLLSGIPILSLQADRTIRRIVSAERRLGKLPNPEPELVDAYRELSNAEMLHVYWADNTAHALMGTTNLARSYVVDGIIEGKTMDVNISPVFNNEVYAHAVSNAAATITVTNVIKVIDESTLDPDDKNVLKDGIGAIEEASEKKDKSKFLDALEKVASIAKNSTDVAGVVIPLIIKYAAGLIG